MCLLTVKAVDGDDRIFFVAFAVVHRESNDNREYFLNLLRYAVVDEHLCPNDVCIISDCYKGIIHAIQTSFWVNNPHRFCIRHIASNYNTRFKNEHLKNIVEKLGREPQKRKFAATMKRLRSRNRETYDWLRALDREIVIGK